MSIYIILVFIVACSAQPGEPEQTEIVAAMNEASELALLMRSIHSDAKDWRKAIATGTLPTGEVDIYDALVQSKPTKAAVQGPVFEGMARNYQRVIDSLFAADTPEVAKLQYNQVVVACLSCHEAYCPGPIPTIKKLRLPL